MKMKMKMNTCRFLLGFTVMLMLLIALPVLAHAEEIPIDEAHFPDENFRYFLSDRYGDTLSENEIAGITIIDVSDEHIPNLTGIEYFFALKYLRCYDNNVTALDVSSNTALIELSCSNNNLTSLDVSKNTALKNLSCYGNKLATLDVTNNTALNVLSCFNNNLTALNVTNNTALLTLNCSSNALTALDVSKNTGLEWLYCNNNYLTALDVSKNTALERLYCFDNNLVALDVSKNVNLDTLYCFNNSISNTAALEAWLSQSRHYGQVLPQNVIPSEHTLTVNLNGGSGGTTGGFYNSGTVLPINAGTRQGYTFYKWTSSNGGTFTDARSAQTDFTMPAADTTITANWAMGDDDIPIDEAHFPDENFRSYLIEEFGDIITPARIAATTNINVSYENISDLTGIEYFFALENLRCSENQLTTLDVSMNTALVELDIYDNELTTLDLSQNTALLELNCYDNSLEWINVSQCTSLEMLVCYNNKLESLDVTNNTALNTLECYDNNLKTLDVSKNTALEYLECSRNNLTSLDVTKNTQLSILACSDNNLTSLDVSKNTLLERFFCEATGLTSLNLSNNTVLDTIYCGHNSFSSLDVSNNVALRFLSCYNSNLTSLDVSNNKTLKQLECSKNNLTSLDVSENTSLTYLRCLGNALTSLDLSHNTALYEFDCIENNLFSLDISNNKALASLKCNDNYLTSLDISKNDKLVQLYCQNNYIVDTAALEAWLAKSGHYGKVTPQKVPQLHTFTVNINGGSGAATSGEFIIGTAVPIDAGTKENYTFYGWMSTNGGAFADAYNASTDFTMPDAETTITANWIGDDTQVGDANGDDEINNRDVVKILIWADAEAFVPIDDQLARADVVKDLKVTIADARALIERVAGLNGQ